jgi:MFS family permease
MSPRDRLDRPATEALREPLLLRSSSSDTESRTEERLAAEGPPKVSRNVPLVLAYTAFVFAGRAVWSQSVLSTFVFLVKSKDYRAVGFITAVMGVSQLLTSFPAGYYSDRFRRDTLLKGAAVVGVTAVGATLYACWRGDYAALVAGLAVWGCYWGISNTSMSALFADSIPQGQRSKYFTQRSLLVNLGFALGPTVSLTMFYILGDEWHVRECAIVLAVGQIMCLPAMLILCFLRDEDDVVHEGTSEDDPATGSMPEDEEEAMEIVPTDPAEMTGQDAALEGVGYFCGCIPRDRQIASLVAMADLTSGLASGMSIRYFPIFFAENLNMGPVFVQCLYISSPLVLACLMKIAQRLSQLFGRCHVAVSFKWMGVLLMFALIASYQSGQPRWLTCLLYVVRTAFMNSTGALTRSVLMDHVPKSERGRWAALESLNMFSWSGSALLGGFLVGYIGMVPLFATTAIIQFMGTFPLMALFRQDALEGQPAAAPPPLQDTGRLSQPLLTNGDDTDETSSRTS